jgi:cytoskeletal protein CcmA (bactofilin family)
MFGQKKKENTNQTTASTANSKSTSTSVSTSNSACVIVNGTVIEGDFYSKNDTRLDGMIKGTVKCDARLIMGNAGEIEGTVKSTDANISGELKGDLEVSGLLSLSETARLTGSIKAGKIEIEEGAVLNGDVTVS